MADDKSIRVPIYSVEVTDYVDGMKTYRTWTFDKSDHTIVYSRVSDDLISKSFADADRLGFVEAPAGSKMCDLDGETVMVLPWSIYGFTAQEIKEMARSGEYEGLTWQPSVAPAV